MNAFNPSTSYFDLIPVEEKVRTFSNAFPNFYFLVFYACCREIFNKDKHMLIKNLKRVKEADQLI